MMKAVKYPNMLLQFHEISYSYKISSNPFKNFLCLNFIEKFNKKLKVGL